ncbi:hypothetical protein OS493_001047 [Desmophyllum pertusum]|uniref:Uncharacterized protein n=1 Tax=Desmophyllum pertusum TaxID=174260 RepID=A0A9X0D5K4_9CNID|nr:hypothetical protein OS493_001047 [Desmophyllum pertusum]
MSDPRLLVPSGSLPLETWCSGLNSHAQIPSCEEKLQAVDVDPAVCESNSMSESVKDAIEEATEILRSSTAFTENSVADVFKEKEKSFAETETTSFKMTSPTSTSSQRTPLLLPSQL